jgi:hypothetical protein
MKLAPLFTILLFSLVSNMLQGQYIPIVEEDKFWIYLYCWDEDHPQAVSGHAITFQGDTVINSVSYKKVYRYGLNGGHHCQFPPCFEFDRPYQSFTKQLVAFIREDTVSRKVYTLPLLHYEFFCDTVEHLILDYALSIDDTLNTCLYDFIGAKPEYPFEPLGIVDSIQVVPSFGKDRNTIFTTGVARYGGLPYYSQVLLLEGIGLEYYGIFHEGLTYLVDFCEGGIEACELILSNTPVESEKEVIISPNPTQGLFTVTIAEELLNATCTIVNSLGQTVQSFKLTERNSTGQLHTPGIYFWRIELDGRFIKTGKIICE